jgi:hypothetical protein
MLAMCTFSGLRGIMQAYFKFHNIPERKHFIYFINDVVLWKFNPTLHLAEIVDELSYGWYN